MAKFTVNRSIIIPANSADIFNKINDFHHWAHWSPWLILEEGVEVNVDEDGKFYKWNGKNTGNGQMRISGESLNKSISIDLEFFKPQKSKAKVEFILTEVEGGTKVDWNMESSLPFFVFFLKKMIAGFIGMDFERGLKLLKDFVLDGKVHSSPKLIGKVDYPGCRYIGIRHESNMDDLSQDIKAKFNQIMTLENCQPLFINGLTITHKWDMTNRVTAYTAAMAVSDFPSELPVGFVKGEIPATPAFKVTHIGRYDHLGNAWSMLSMLIRNRVFKNNSKIHPFEVYVSSPLDTPQNESITDVYFPMK